MLIPASIKKFFRSRRAVVLMYHRIAETAADPWQIAVGPKNFESQLSMLTTSCEIVSLEDLLTMHRQRRPLRDCVCITFDDGYEDNYLNALPLLEKYTCPATFFIASASIGSNAPYWWDTLTEIFLLADKLPSRLQLCFNNKEIVYELEHDGILTPEDRQLHARWHWPDNAPTQRCEIYLDLWISLKDLPDSTIQETVATLIEWSGVEPVNSHGNFPMTRMELVKMSENKFVDIGVHTVTHAALAAFPLQTQEAEISGCREYLDDNLKGKHSIVAYPYGNYNEDTRTAARNSGMKAAFTTEPKVITTRSDLFQLGRFQVFDEPGEQLSKRLNAWLNE